MSSLSFGVSHLNTVERLKIRSGCSAAKLGASVNAKTAAARRAENWREKTSQAALRSCLGHTDGKTEAEDPSRRAYFSRAQGKRLAGKSAA